MKTFTTLTSFFAILILLTTSVVGQSDDPNERVRLWRVVNQHQIASRVYTVEMAHWWHIEGNESKTPEDYVTETGESAPDATNALDSAMKIARANPTDDLGYLALSFCLVASRSVDGPENYVLPVLDLYADHYLTDARIANDLLSLARTASGDTNAEIRDAKLKLLKSVVSANTAGSELRLNAAYYSASERADWVNNLRKSENERNEIRNELVALAEIAISEGEGHKFFGQPAPERATQLVCSLQNLSVGGSLPNVGVHVIGGGDDELKNYRGKIVLVDFWATWCVPCVASLPKVVKLKNELEGKPFEVIAVSVDENDELVQKFMKERMELPFINWRTSFDSDLYQNWMISGVPTYFLIDENGVIHGRSNDVESLAERAKELVAELSSQR